MRIRYFITLLALSLILPFFVACNDSDEMAANEEMRTYKMRLNVTFCTYDKAATRAESYIFKEGDQLYVLFEQVGAKISGTATYEAATGLWTITPSQPLSETDDGACKLAFFLDSPSSTNDVVMLTQQTRIYTDNKAAYQLIDGLLNVQGQLSPALGRIRFHGSAGQKCTVTGLSFTEEFNLSTHTFVLSPSRFTAVCETDGYTPYFYCAFTDSNSPILTFVQTSESGWRKIFGQEVLAAGTSGYVNIPTSEAHEGWTLINLEDGGEIHLPSVSIPLATNVHSSLAILSAEVTSAGGGHISSTGFVISTNHNPTRNDQNIECNSTISLGATVNGLTPQTTYYIRAYAVNEAGITYSEEIQITTLAKAEDNSEVTYEEWTEDHNWNDYQSGSDNLDYIIWPEDINWN